MEGVGNWELVNPVGIYMEPNGTLQSHCSTILTPLHHCTCSVVQGLFVCRREFPDPIWSDYLISASQWLRRNAPSNRTQPWDSLLERGGRGAGGGRGLVVTLMMNVFMCWTVCPTRKPGLFMDPVSDRGRLL